MSFLHSRDGAVERADLLFCLQEGRPIIFSCVLQFSLSSSSCRLSFLQYSLSFRTAIFAFVSSSIRFSFIFSSHCPLNTWMSTEVNLFNVFTFNTLQAWFRSRWNHLLCNKRDVMELWRTVGRVGVKQFFSINKCIKMFLVGDKLHCLSLIVCSCAVS